MYVYIRISTNVTYTDNISKLIYLENQKISNNKQRIIFGQRENTYRSNVLTDRKKIVNKLYQ